MKFLRSSYISSGADIDTNNAYSDISNFAALGGLKHVQTYKPTIYCDVARKTPENTVYMLMFAVTLYLYISIYFACHPALTDRAHQRHYQRQQMLLWPFGPLPGHAFTWSTWVLEKPADLIHCCLGGLWQMELHILVCFCSSTVVLAGCFVVIAVV